MLLHNSGIAATSGGTGRCVAIPSPRVTIQADTHRATQKGTGNNILKGPGYSLTLIIHTNWSIRSIVLRNFSEKVGTDKARNYRTSEPH